MEKAFLVSGIKNGKEKAWAFRTWNQARAKYDKVKFEKGWRDLGISEISSFDEAKRMEKALN